ncbi:MAG: hypothetical protein AAGD22_09625 [Verrucomicrobiota bacterium]
MSTNVSGAAVVARTKDLAEKWHQTKDSWRDAKCQEFEAAYIQPLLDAVSSTGSVIEELDKALRKIRKDCD